MVKAKLSKDDTVSFTLGDKIDPTFENFLDKTPLLYLTLENVIPP
jgi:hypothetical protein